MFRRRPPNEAKPLTGGWPELVSELLLLGLAVITLWNASALFSESLLQADLMFLTYLIHFGWAVARRVRLPLLPTIIINGAVTFALYSYLRYNSSASRLHADDEVVGGFWDKFTADWDATIKVLNEEIVPLPLRTGFLLIVVILVFILSGLADWSSFRVRASSADGVVVYGCIFVAIMLFREGGQRALSAILFAVFALAFVLMHRVFSNQKRAPIGIPVLLGTGAVVAAFVLGAGMVGGLALKPEGEPFRIDLSEWQNVPAEPEPPRRVLNPLVEIKSQLVNQSDEKLFTVLTDEAQYWRITALDVFNGSSWSSSYTYNPASGNLNSDIPSGTDRSYETLNQSYSLEDFESDWVPAAFDAQRVSNHSRSNYDLLYDSNSSTLLVDTDQPSVDGLTYSVRSNAPTFNSDLLNQATFADYNSPENLADAITYTALPSDVSATARAAAEAATAEADTPFGKALALQNWFRSDFTYNLDVDRGHSIERVEDFLAVKQGYCEQFAATYAMMARMLGIPSRVVIGFTWGEPTEQPTALADFTDVELGGNIPQQAYTVFGRQYHSWAEVLIPGAGWVLMEPTPSRGPPNSPHTQIAPEQDQVTPTTLPNQPELTTTTTTTLPPDSPGGTDVTQVTQVPGQDQDQDSPVTTEPPTTTTLPPEEEPDSSSSSDSGTNAGLIVIMFVAAAALLWALIFPARGAWYLRRIQHNTGERTLLAWRRARLAWQRAGMHHTSSTTLHEFAAQVAGQNEGGMARNPLAQLADKTAKVSYGSTVPDSAETEAAENLSRLARQQALQYIPKWKRLLGFGVTSPYWLGGQPRN